MPRTPPQLLALRHLVQVRVEVEDKRPNTLQFRGDRPVELGRARGLSLRLPHASVSSHHARLECEQDGSLWIRDLGSTNGTWIGKQRLTRPTRVLPETPVVIGPFTLYARTRNVGDAAYRRVTIPSRAIPKSQRMSAQPAPEPSPPAGFALGSRSILAGAVILGLVGLGLASWGGAKIEPAPVVMPQQQAQPLKPTQEHRALAVTADDLQDDQVGEHPDKDGQAGWITHRSIPGESLTSVAARYGVSASMLLRWNEVNRDPSEPLPLGTTLRIVPEKSALPPQKIRYLVKSTDTLLSLAQQFSLSTDQIHAFNPQIDRIQEGQELTLWVEPQSAARIQADQDSQTPAIQAPTIEDHAISHGLPQGGTLEAGIQLPELNELYRRAQPKEQYGSSHLLRHLIAALIRFRSTYGFEGEIVVGDISIKGGGHFPPHKSHQSGRDVDIWLPTRGGTYHTYPNSEYLRRAEPEEVDWFATWHLIKSLIETKEVYKIFLSYDLQAHVHSAAKLSGATNEELSSIIQYPYGDSKAILRHSQGHRHHIHVRFTCPKTSKPSGGAPCRL